MNVELPSSVRASRPKNLGVLRLITDRERRGGGSFRCRAAGVAGAGTQHVAGRRGPRPKVTHIITAFMQIDSEVTADGRILIEVELLTSQPPRQQGRRAAATPAENNIDLFPITALLCSAYYTYS